MYSTKDRVFNNSLWQFTDEADDEEPYRGDPVAFFGPENVGIIGFDENTERNILGWYPINQVRATNKNNYTGTETISAVYGMATYDLGKLRIIGGARVERTDIEVMSRDTSFPVGDIEATDLLPSLSLIYRVNENMNVRAVATQTLARPNMRELAPFSSFDRGTDFRTTGDPSIVRTNIQNYDLRWEWYPRPGELIAVSGYLKNFNNPIIKGFNIVAPNPEIRYTNVDEARVYGIEFELRKKLDFIADFLKDVRFIFNTSIIESEVDIPGDPDDQNTEQGNIAEFNPEKGFTRPFQGQSPYLINAALNYINPDNGIDAILSFNVFGERLTLNNAGADPDFFEQPIPQLDFTFKKVFAERYGIKVSAQNILNSNYQELIRFGGNDFIIREYERGITFGLSISYNIK